VKTRGKILLRPFVLRDFRAVHALWAGIEGVGLNESDTRPAIAVFLRRNRGLSLVATSGGRMVGAVLCGHDGRRGYLHHLAVLPEFRRRGIGRKMVATCLGSLAAAGIQKCNLFLFADNRRGAVFWQRGGWKARGDLKVLQRTTKRSPCAPGRGC
jgi:ribosomal protein S18 acetylase RimI-like enzyme